MSKIAALIVIFSMSSTVFAQEQKQDSNAECRELIVNNAARLKGEAKAFLRSEEDDLDATINAQGSRGGKTSPEYDIALNLARADAQAIVENIRRLQLDKNVELQQLDLLLCAKDLDVNKVIFNQ